MDQSCPNMLAPRVSQRFLNFPVARKRRLWVWKPSPSRSWTESLMEQYVFLISWADQTALGLGSIWNSEKLYGVVAWIWIFHDRKNILPETVCDLCRVFIFSRQQSGKSTGGTSHIFFESDPSTIHFMWTITLWNWPVYYPCHVHKLVNLTHLLSILCGKPQKWISNCFLFNSTPVKMIWIYFNQNQINQ